jgi:8-oxo-dGTP pyrophosphatase MutT (NUDIX family)
MKPTHAGGIVYRVSDGVVKFLLVGPKKDRPGEWVPPKGHIEKGESPDQTAIREVREETGITARIMCPLKTLEFEVNEKSVRAVFYLMELISEAEPAEKRRRSWFSLGDAVSRATHADVKALLKEAADRLAAA